MKKFKFVVCLSVISFKCCAEVSSSKCADDQYLCRPFGGANDDLCCPCDISLATDVPLSCFSSCAPKYQNGDCSVLMLPLTCPAGKAFPMTVSRRKSFSIL